MTKSRDKFDRWIIASLMLHAGIVLVVFVAPTMFGARTDTWGSRTGGSGGVNVKIVTSMPGIALPAPPAEADEAPVGKNQSLHKAPPVEKAKPADKPDPNALKLSDKDKAKKPAKAAPAQTASLTPPEPPSNAVSYGTGGGAPRLQYGQNGNAGPTGAEFGGDGTFGDKYGAYVEAMTRAISNEWVKVAVNAGQRTKIYVTFSIRRDGTIENSQIDRSSNQNSNSLAERAALRAVQAAKLNPLPADYRGPDVTVRFYFDYAR